MELNQLRALVETARRGSFSEAARHLGLTQSGLSRQIQGLERELGVTLIDREQRPVTVTLAGGDFVACAESVIVQIDEAVRRLGVLASEPAGSLTVVASTIPGEFLVPGLLAKFTSRHPLVRPYLVLTDSAGVIERLLTHEAEIGFLGAPLAPSRLPLTPFAEDEVVLVVPYNHPFASRLSIDLSELAGQLLVEREDGSGTLDSLHRILTKRGAELPKHKVAIITDTSQAQLASIEAGMGIGFVSSLALANRPVRKVTSVPIEGLELRRPLYFSYQTERLSSTAQAFVDFILEES